jgi:thiol-disulfide isomerase/thioredoxin
MIRSLLALMLLCVSARAASIPRPAPEFVIRNSTGEVLLSQFRGKVVLLTFIHTTCPHCQQSIGVLNQLQREYGPHGFQTLGSAFNEMAAQLLPEFVTRFRPIFPVGFTSRETVNEYLKLPAEAPFKIPVYVFIDKKGTLRALHVAGEPFFQDDPKNTRAMIESLLKGPAQTKQGARKGPASSSVR